MGDFERVASCIRLSVSAIMKLVLAKSMSTVWCGPEICGMTEVESGTMRGEGPSISRTDTIGRSGNQTHIIDEASHS